VDPLTSAAPSVEIIAGELEMMSGRAIPRHPETFRFMLEDSLANDGYVCQPRPSHVFFGLQAPGERVVHGVMPHYGFFFGPMRYRLRRRPDGWEVMVRVALDPPPESETLELPDCALRGALDGPVHCSGAPYSSSPKTEPCPASGRFSAPATRRNVEALLARWSREVEQYWNRDAAAFGLPVRYDFDFVPSDVARLRSLPVDIDLPLWSTCGRTPYFSAMRSGWSLPVIAHEVGHVLGLLDEYEAFSGIVAAYPKTPFPGADVSRMGLSMRETTRLLPLHHYLVVRRYFCLEPARRDPFAGVP
jgi:hypothetical protein